MEQKFEFKKLGNGKCQFIRVMDEILRVETVSEAFAKNYYKDLVTQRAEVQNNLGIVHRQLEQNKIEKDLELEHFIDLNNRAAKYQKHLEAEANLKANLDLLKLIDDSMKPIEFAMPEVKRMKK